MRDHHQRRGDQPGAELDEEDDADRGQLDHRRGDVEQQEIEHHVDALGAALDDLGQAAGAPLEVEAQRQIVDVAEHPCRPAAAPRAARPSRTWRCADCRPAPRRSARRHKRAPARRRRANAAPVPRHPVDHRLVGERHQQHRAPCRPAPAPRRRRPAPSARPRPSATASAGSAAGSRSRRRPAGFVVVCRGRHCAA